MKILLTGGSGFIASHILKKLKNSYDVCTVDRLDSIYGNPLTNFICDLSDFDKTLKLFEENSFDIVIHCATVPLVQSIVAPQKSYLSIVKMALNLVEIQRLGYFDKLLNFSTSEVYGKSSESDFLKETSPKNPMTPYASAKLSSDKLIKSYSNCFGLKYFTLRPFNQYGVGKRTLKNAGIIQQTFNSIKTGNRMNLFYEGQTKRDFVYVATTVSIVKEVIDRDLFVNDEFNLSSGKTISMIEIVQKIEKIFELEVKKNFLKEGRKGDILYLRGDSTKLHQLLGYDVEHNFNKNFEVVVRKLWKV